MGSEGKERERVAREGMARGRETEGWEGRGKDGKGCEGRGRDGTWRDGTETERRDWIWNGRKGKAGVHRSSSLLSPKGAYW